MLQPWVLGRDCREKVLCIGRYEEVEEGGKREEDKRIAACLRDEQTTPIDRGGNDGQLGEDKKRDDDHGHHGRLRRYVGHHERGRGFV